MKDSETIGVTKKELPMLQLVDDSKEFNQSVEELNEFESSDMNMQKLVEYISENCAKDAHKHIKTPIVEQKGKTYKVFAKKDIEEENRKALNIMKGCTQLKQVKVAIDVYMNLKESGITISAEV